MRYAAWLGALPGGLLGAAPPEKGVAPLMQTMSGCSALVESMHGVGAPHALRFVIGRQANPPQRTNIAKALPGEGTAR